MLLQNLEAPWLYSGTRVIVKQNFVVQTVFNETQTIGAICIVEAIEIVTIPWIPIISSDLPNASSFHLN